MSRKLNFFGLEYSLLLSKLFLNCEMVKILSTFQDHQFIKFFALNSTSWNSFTLSMLVTYLVMKFNLCPSSMTLSFFFLYSYVFLFLFSKFLFPFITSFRVLFPDLIQIILAFNNFSFSILSFKRFEILSTQLLSFFSLFFLIMYLLFFKFFFFNQFSIFHFYFSSNFILIFFVLSFEQLILFLFFNFS